MVESTSSSSEDEGDNQLIRRLPLFLKKQHSLGSEDEGGDEEPFLPFSAGDANFSPRDAAMGGTVTLQPRPSTDNSGRNGLDSSRPGVDGYGLRNNSTTRRRSSILDSPRRRAVADSAGPSSPSMGSSFSDLSGIASLIDVSELSANHQLICPHRCKCLAICHGRGISEHHECWRAWKSDINHRAGGRKSLFSTTLNGSNGSA